MQNYYLGHDTFRDTLIRPVSNIGSVTDATLVFTDIAIECTLQTAEYHQRPEAFGVPKPEHGDRKANGTEKQDWPAPIAVRCAPEVHDGQALCQKKYGFLSRLVLIRRSSLTKTGCETYDYPSKVACF
jgi:hypothetical protein